MGFWHGLDGEEVATFVTNTYPRERVPIVVEGFRAAV